MIYLRHVLRARPLPPFHVYDFYFLFFFGLRCVTFLPSNPFPDFSLLSSHHPSPTANLLLLPVPPHCVSISNLNQATFNMDDRSGYKIVFLHYTPFLTSFFSLFFFSFFSPLALSTHPILFCFPLSLFVEVAQLCVCIYVARVIGVDTYI
jgi:hypothetical protein